MIKRLKLQYVIYFLCQKVMCFCQFLSHFGAIFGAIFEENWRLSNWMLKFCVIIKLSMIDYYIILIISENQLFVYLEPKTFLTHSGEYIL